jgi:hypothetical protein
MEGSTLPRFFLIVDFLHLNGKGSSIISKNSSHYLNAWNTAWPCGSDVDFPNIKVRLWPNFHFCFFLPWLWRMRIKKLPRKILAWYLIFCLSYTTMKFEFWRPPLKSAILESSSARESLTSLIVSTHAGRAT